FLLLRLPPRSTLFPYTTLFRSLLALGFNVSQVVHDYGDICQAITELALDQNAPIAIEEFHTLNRCLDTAIAEALTEHARLTAQRDRKSTRLNSSHRTISYAVFC